MLPSPAAWLCLAHRDAPAVQRRSSCTGTLRLYRDAPAMQGRSSCTGHSGCTGTLQLCKDTPAVQGRSSYTGTLQLGRYQGPRWPQAARWAQCTKTSTSSQVDRRQVHLDFGPDSNRRYLLSDIRPCLAIRPSPNSIACVQTSYKTMVIYSRFYGMCPLHPLQLLILLVIRPIRY